MKILLSVIFCFFDCFICHVPSKERENPGRSKNIHQPKYSLFYDNHTMPAIPDVREKLRRGSVLPTG
ncbi:MAG: hypothetical protein AB2L24_09145 [Mangrovibacterium sp.]